MIQGFKLCSITEKGKEFILSNTGRAKGAKITKICDEPLVYEYEFALKTKLALRAAFSQENLADTIEFKTMKEAKKLGAVMNKDFNLEILR